MFVVEVELIDDGFHDAFCIIRIINGEALWVTESLCLASEDPGENGVEGADVQVPCFVVAEDMFDAFLHLPGSLVCEGQGQNSERIDPVGHEVSDAGSEHFGFAAACTGNDHEGAFQVKDCFPLLVVQTLQIVLHDRKLG